MKDNKCVNYMNEIRYYRDQCYEVQGLLAERKEVLRVEKDRTACLEAELGEIGVSCERKKKELEGLIQAMRNMMEYENT